MASVAIPKNDAHQIAGYLQKLENLLAKSPKSRRENAYDLKAIADLKAVLEKAPEVSE